MVQTSRGDEIQISTSTDQLKQVREFTEQLCREGNLDEDDGGEIVTAVGEAVSSIVHHARAIDNHGKVRLNVEIDDIRFRALIEDLTNRTSDRSTGSEKEDLSFRAESKRHKLGIYLMQRSMDEINYTFKKGFQNELELIYFFDDGK